MLFWILVIFTAAAGLILTVSWLWKKKICSVPTQAQVIRVICVERKKMGKDAFQYFPVYRFVCEGREYEVQPMEAARTRRWVEGQREMLMIDPSKPTRFRRKGEMTDLLYGIGSLAFCLLLLAAEYLG